MDNLKYVLEGKYTLGGGIGCWAKSLERGVKPGDVRVIGKILMYAYYVYPRRFRVAEVSWIPVDESLGREYQSLKQWMQGK